MKTTHNTPADIMTALAARAVAAHAVAPAVCRDMAAGGDAAANLDRVNAALADLRLASSVWGCTFGATDELLFAVEDLIAKARVALFTLQARLARA